MKFVLQRYSDNGNSTLGLMLKRSEVPHLQFYGYTLEDEGRTTKVHGETRIWSGEYELQLRKELSPMTQRYRHRFPWFSWHVELINVPLFSFVYVHIGNKEKHTDACILMADTANNNQIEAGFIGRSTQCYRRWYEEVVPLLEGGVKVFIEIKDEGRLW